MFERLTIKTDICIEPENEIVYHNPNDPEGMYNILDLAECLYSGGAAEAGILMEISRRLAAYEDTGLSPNEVQELAQAKAEGRLVVLPCKVGDVVYVTVTDCDCTFEMYGCFDCPYVVFPCDDIFRYDEEEWECGFVSHVEATEFCVSMYDEVGKTVFLTREEAEAALRKEQEK